MGFILCMSFDAWKPSASGEISFSFFQCGILRSISFFDFFFFRCRIMQEYEFFLKKKIGRPPPRPWLILITRGLILGKELMSHRSDPRRRLALILI
ncbi:Uncharacterized protein TCM_042697 [Theobroma cacao]|uniref:Uncharacterized protein n=1 Tax=Theobroma cacao TaxID=3641 RepID=A0A061FTK6_THECC|nr:Uncharacterized protein TCM_042697 [Theobroma cacao]